MDQQVEGAVVETTRKLATIRRIDAIEPIPNADAIEVATIGGWKVVVKKGDFAEGDHGLYLEIDSWVPHELAPFLSRGHEPRDYNGVKGERLRTVKLRGQVSQGLLIPIHGDNVPEAVSAWMLRQLFAGTASEYVKETRGFEGADLTEVLNVQKWERPLDKRLAGQARGNFPSFIRKTDQERVQNLLRQYGEAVADEDLFEVTVKMDGSSMTVYHTKSKGKLLVDGVVVSEDAEVTQVGVCSRNLELKLDQEGNAFVDTATNSGLLEALKKLSRNIAVQGELCGPNIQGNSENLSAHHFYIFDVFDIDQQRYLNPAERFTVYQELRGNGANVSHVKIVSDSTRLLPTVADALAAAEGKNDAGNEREGLVYKRLDGQFSFKAISNRFLLKGGE